MKLGRDVFVALAAIAWADGSVEEAEAKALLAGAHASGLVGDDLEALHAALLEPMDLARVSSLSLSEEEGEFLYAIAAWLTRVDGHVTEDETSALAKLGALLRLGDDARARGLTVTAALDVPASGSARDVLALAREIERVAAEG